MHYNTIQKLTNQRERIKEGTLKIKEDPISMLLRESVSRNGIQAYKDSKLLCDFLIGKNVNRIKVKQINMILTESSFLNYLDKINDGISPIEVNNIIKSAIPTGMTLKTIQEVVTILLNGLGIFQDINIVFIESNNPSNKELYISTFECKETLGGFEDQIEKNKALNASQLEYINCCCKAGVSDAYRIKGILYLKGINISQNYDAALNCFLTAESMGDIKSLLYMGDCYYEKEKYKEAYDCYTGFGTYAISPATRVIVRNLIEIKKFCKKEMFITLVLGVVIEMYLLIVPFETSLSLIQTFLKILCLLLNVAITVLTFIKYRKNSYYDFRKCSLFYALVLSVYIFFCILF